MAHSATGPVGSDSLGPAELLDALRSGAEVLGQHAVALDRLGSPDGWTDRWADGVAAADDGAASEQPSSGRDEPEVIGLQTEAPTAEPSDDASPGPGTDMATTLAAGCDAADGATDFSTLCGSLAAGASPAARTAAGHRLAEFLAGTGDALRNADRVDGARLALALEAGAERVTERDDGAHPGCLLAVMSAAADGALAASDRREGLDDVLVSAAEAGLEELEQGPLVDARLAERGTVDAAAAAFLLLLDSIAAVVSGDPLPEPPRETLDEPGRSSTPAGADRHVVQCLVTAPRADIESAAELESTVHELSDELEFRVQGAQWTVRAVTALPGSVVEALAGAGELSEVRIGLAPSV